MFCGEITDFGSVRSCYTDSDGYDIINVVLKPEWSTRRIFNSSDAPMWIFQLGDSVLCNGMSMTIINMEKNLFHLSMRCDEHGYKLNLLVDDIVYLEPGSQQILHLGVDFLEGAPVHAHIVDEDKANSKITMKVSSEILKDMCVKQKVAINGWPMRVETLEKNGKATCVWLTRTHVTVPRLVGKTVNMEVFALCKQMTSFARLLNPTKILNTKNTSKL